MDWLRLNELMENANIKRTQRYSCKYPDGTIYELKHDLDTGVLQVTRNILRDPNELKLIEGALKAGPAESLELTVQPVGKKIKLGRVTKIEYI